MSFRPLAIVMPGIIGPPGRIIVEFGFCACSRILCIFWKMSICRTKRRDGVSITDLCLLDVLSNWAIGTFVALSEPHVGKETVPVKHESTLGYCSGDFRSRHIIRVFEFILRISVHAIRINSIDFAISSTTWAGLYRGVCVHGQVVGDESSCAIDILVLDQIVVDVSVESRHHLVARGAILVWCYRRIIHHHRSSNRASSVGIHPRYIYLIHYETGCCREVKRFRRVSKSVFCLVRLMDRVGAHSWSRVKWVPSRVPRSRSWSTPADQRLTSVAVGTVGAEFHEQRRRVERGGSIWHRWHSVGVRWIGASMRLKRCLEKTFVKEERTTATVVEELNKLGAQGPGEEARRQAGRPGRGRFRGTGLRGGASSSSSTAWGRSHTNHDRQCCALNRVCEESDELRQARR